MSDLNSTGCLVTTFETGSLGSYRYVVVFARYGGKWLYCRAKERSCFETAGGHIEPGETPLDAARRELWEETGAVKFDISAAFDYSVCKPSERSNGQVFVAEISELGPMPDFEMSGTALFDGLPDSLRFPEITPLLFNRVAKQYALRCGKTVLETERLVLRRLAPSDFGSLCLILQDPGAMYAYEGAFSDDEVRAWLQKQLDRYAQYGFGLWAVILKETGEFIGQCGLTMQDFDGRQVLEIGYLFRREFWHRGYAAEAAVGCRRFAFDVLGADEVFSIIRDTNTASQNVAKRVGMTVTGGFTKHYRGIDMPHVVYSVKRRAAE